jgi:hypothetical protein
MTRQVPLADAGHIYDQGRVELYDGRPVLTPLDMAAGIQYRPTQRVAHRNSGIEVEEEKMNVFRLSWLLIVALFAGSVLAAGRPASVVTAAGGTDHFGPFPGSSPDSGSCGNNWANDTYQRDFTVRANGDGTFNVEEQFKDGTFVTVAGASPGACEQTPHHGSVVVAGISGNLQGYERGIVTGGAYNPEGCSTNPVSCSTTAGFIATTFGAGAQFACITGVGTCTFNFEYSSNDQRLTYRHWQDNSDNAAPRRGGLKLEGDIATQ